MEMNVEQMITEDDELILPMSIEYREDITIDDFKEICRICGNCSNQLMPIFSGDGLEHNLSRKIKEYLPITVSFDDDLPSNICYQCASTLISWHELYYACKEADQRLKQLSSNLFGIEKTAVNFQDIIEDKPDYGEDVPDSIFVPSKVLPKDVDKGAPEGDFSKIHEKPMQLTDINDRCTPLNSNVLSISSTEFRMIIPQASRDFVDVKDNTIKTCAIECDALNSSFGAEVLSNTDTDLIVNEGNTIQPEVELQPKTKSCDVCGRHFLNSVNLVVHTNELRIIRANPKLFQVSHRLSEKTSVDSSKSEDIFECADCHEKFNEKTSLRVHIFSEHLERKKYECDICHWRYHTECDLATHRSVHSLNDKLICRFCGGRCRVSVRRRYERTSNLVDCTCSFRTDSSVQEIETNLPLIKSKLRPSIPLSVVKSVSSSVKISDKRRADEWWERDVKVPPPVRRIQNVHLTKCKLCHEECGSYYTLKKHMRTHEKRVYCDICGKKYLKHYLKTHMLIHSSVKTFACDKCGKAFAQKSSLRAHQMLEDNVKKFMCNICGMQFVLSSRMQWHMKTHMEAKPFKCKDCNKEYGYLWQLNQHRVAHSNERKFVCECCAKSYKTMKHLRQHWHHYPCHRK